MRARTWGGAAAFLAALLLLFAPGSLLAQAGTITGQVTSGEGEPLAGARVTLEGTGYGGVTGADGVFTLSSVDPGTYNVVVEMLSYADGRAQNVTVRSGETTDTGPIALRQEALRLQELFVSGVADPVEGVRMPFTVSRISRDRLPVPQTNMMQALQGRVAGARVATTSGRPGTGMNVRLRARQGVETSDQPLLIVDGVQLTANVVDLDALDIESMEVLKGAAASSMYGSRAQAGVIEITTRRGGEVEVGTTRITARTEYGQSFTGDIDKIADHHPYQVDGEGYYLDGDGNRITEIEDRVNRVLREDRMMLSPYQTFHNHLDVFFDPGSYLNTSVNVAQNLESTNFFVSFADNRESGIAPGFNEGYHRQNMRFNLDHRVRDDLTVAFTTFHSRSSNQRLTGGNPFYNLRFIAPDVDLTRPNHDGQPYIIQPDPTSNEDSPLYSLWAQDDWDYRSRIQGSTAVRFNPVGWLNLDALFAFDRSDRERHRIRPDNFLTNDPDETLDGLVDRRHNFDETYNGHVQATLIRAFGDLTVRARPRYVFSSEEGSGFRAWGTGYNVSGIPTLNNMIERNISGGEWDHVREEGFILNTGLDYQNKYIGDFLVRRDGSSLFGPENRWHTYFRASLSYLMSEEDWWPVDALTAFKPRYSIGTAGARPGFDWQYETWSVDSSGPSKGRLGNRNLAPEKTTEQDMGLDMILNDRYSLELTYAISTVDDQLIPVPLPGFFGYGSQWQNAGQVKTKAYEATFEAALVQSPTTSWNMGVVMDHSDSWLEEWERTCYRTSNFYRCQGESFSTIRRPTWMSSHADLPSWHQGSEDQFQVNDDGYLVPVGDSDYTDGLNSDGTPNMWGERVVIDDREYDWGIPILIRDEETGQVDDLYEIGDANPLFRMGWTNTLRWRGFNVFSLVDAKIGGDVYNQTRQYPYRDNLSADGVQVGKRQEHMKPIDYYQALYNVNSNNSHFVEDGTFVKLREVSVGYRLSRDQLNQVLGAVGGLGMESLGLNLIGRNLFTLTNYRGIDPEVGSGGAGGSTENPVDNFSYPNFRQFTLSVEVQF